MPRFAPLLLLTVAALQTPAYSQLIPGGAAGDFRVNDRPGTAPTVGPPGGPGLPPDPTMFRDQLGGRTPDEILKNLDKDLGRATLDRSSLGAPTSDPGKDLRAPSESKK